MLALQFSLPLFNLVSKGDSRLQVVSNFGDGNCGRAKYTHVRKILRGQDARGAPKIRFWQSPCIASPPNLAHPTITITKSRDY